MESVDDLIRLRKIVQSFCLRHGRSLEAFRAGLSYKLESEDPLQKGLDELEHLTSTATCLESILHCPYDPNHIDWRTKQYKGKKYEPDVHAEDFAKAALARPSPEWISDESAKIYCRCRALPLVMERCDITDDTRKIVTEHVDVILKQLKIDEARFGIGEADPDSMTEKKDWYPPNSYHSYWTVKILASLKERFTTAYNPDIAARHRTLLLWARQQLGVQIALHDGKSPSLDTDQLGWSIAIQMSQFEAIERLPTEQDLLKRGLACLFDEQQPSGSWRRQRPLFHYRKSGNAYSYVFEMFATILQLALEKKAKFVRHSLRPYVSHLQRLLAFADNTKVWLDDTHGTVGWSSGHRANEQTPESWATASVFAFAQGFRQLLGLWTRDASATRFRKFRERCMEPADATTIFRERGDTWRQLEGLSVAEQLVTTFVNPVLKDGQFGREHMDPDLAVVDDHGARSAILFGPPGTSKTTLTSAIAGALGWSYVEIHASDFLSEGLDNVYRTAERIFLDLMEMDHCVILFDEIDELVRRREGEPDASERFLTTSMLPKLAELWKQRRVLYFVATNYLDEFDAAITRGERFDALVFVPPPSFEAKERQLTGLMGKRFRYSRDVIFAPKILEDVERAIGEIREQVAGARLGTNTNEAPPEARVLRKRTLESRHVLAKFLLVRWDQLSELAWRICKTCTDGQVTAQVLGDALSKLRDKRLTTMEPYMDYLEAVTEVRRDFGAPSVWRIDGVTASDAESWKDRAVQVRAGRVWYLYDGEDWPLEVHDGRAAERAREEPGCLRVVAPPPATKTPEL